jgi:hypothetical protein
MNESLATMAQYYRIGIEAGICVEDEAREWAFAMIGELQDPPGELIEVSWRKPRPQLLDDLNSVRGEPDLQRVGGWLFAALRQAGPTAQQRLRAALRQAFYIVAGAKLGEDMYYELDCIDDEIALTANGHLGTRDQCVADFDDFLAKHAAPVPPAWPAASA